VAVPVLGGLAAAAVVGIFFQVPDWVLAAASAALIVPGHVLAVAGVARARRGDGWVARPSHRSGRGEGATAGSPRPSPAQGAPLQAPGLAPFRSPQRALFSLAWERGALILPVMVGMVLVPQLILLSFVHDEARSPALALTMLVYPLLMAAGAGTGLGKGYESPRNRLQLAAFVAARPVTTQELLATLLRVALASSLAACSPVLLALLAIMPFTGPGRALAQLLRTFVENHGVKGWALLALGVVGMPALVWRQMVSGMWVSLVGRRWVAYTMTIAMAVGYTAAAVFGGWVYATPASQVALGEALPWVVAALLGLKLLAGVVVVAALWRRRLIAGRTLAGLGLAWVAAAAGIVALAFWLTPAEVASPWLIAAGGILLALPLVRLGLAPLALDWNRHR
jgi:hypothetical protein